MPLGLEGVAPFNSAETFVLSSAAVLPTTFCRRFSSFLFFFASSF